MKQPCGCCAGIEIVTPQPESNRPGLPAISYRLGTHATFFESMLARLSILYLDVPVEVGASALKRLCPLKNLTTRDLSDPAIALLDAWAVVADVLSFYQERLANEGYLRTATERLSVLELARLIGYSLRPGISASVYLAFTAADGFNGVIPRGTRAQSLPQNGGSPLFFETSEDLPARDVWNNLNPRLTRPQAITPPGLEADSTPIPTGADQIVTLYFQGTATNLSVGDFLLVVLGNGDQQQVLRRVRSVASDADHQRTEAVLDDFSPLQVSGDTVQDAVAGVLKPFIDEAAILFAGSDLAGQVSDALNQVLVQITPETSKDSVVGVLRRVLPVLDKLHDGAVKRKFTRLEPWVARVMEDVKALIEAVPNLDALSGKGGAVSIAAGLLPAPLENLTAIVSQLARPPALQPANAQRLQRTVRQTFSPQSDIAPRLLAAFHPAAAPALYQAWAGIETPTSQAVVLAMRAKAGLFPGPYPGTVTIEAEKVDDKHTKTTTSFTTPSIDNSWNNLNPDPGRQALPIVALDGVYDKVQANSWVAVDRPSLNGKRVTKRVTSYHKVVNTQTVSMTTADTGYTAKVTQLTLDPPWLYDLLADQRQLESDLASPIFLHGTVVHLQAEPLDLAEEPLDADVEGSSIELAQLYDGLEAGRWIIVSGERTDIPNTTGVMAGELVMVAAVDQGSRSPGCPGFPAGLMPFSQYFYTTEANPNGDRLVVGLLKTDYQTFLSNFPSPASYSSQRYCDQAELAPGIYANAYVPTKAELAGDFPDFEGLLYIPEGQPGAGQPYPGGQIPIVQPPSTQPQVLAWRISSEPVHTILTLAQSGLAYKYDRETLTIYGNVVKATHGQSVAEVLGNGDASTALQNFALHQPPLTYLPAPTPSGAQSTLSVLVNDVKWQEADSLLALGPNDRGFITRTDDAGQTTVITGDGQHGALVPTGNANVKGLYRSGTGRGGNVAAQQINQLVTQPPGAKNVVNPLPATGGSDGDTRDQARQNAPLAVMALDRLVSVADYADFARAYAGIGKASAVRLSDGRRRLVHLTIAGKDDIPIDQNSDLYQNLVQALLQNGDPYEPLKVSLRRLKLLVISAGVKVQADYLWESVKPAVETALFTYYGFDQRDLGQSAFLSEAVSVMQGVPGVEYVDPRVFDAVPEGIDAQDLAGLAGRLLLSNLVEADLAQVDPAATDPANRILPAELAILTPAIPGTLILTEITS